MGFISKLFGGGASTLVESVGKTLDNLVTTKGEKLTLENEMKKAELEYQIELRKLSLEEQQLELDTTKAYLSDTASARTANAAIQTSANSTNLNKNIAPMLAIGTTALTITLFCIVLFGSKHLPKNQELVFYVLGVLSSIMTQIFAYYFGSSMGSKSKEEALQKATSGR